MPAGLATANPRQPPTAPPPQAGTQPPEAPAQSAPISQTQLCGCDTSRESLHMAGMPATCRESMHATVSATLRSLSLWQATIVLSHQSCSRDQPTSTVTVMSPPLHIPLVPRPCQYSATRWLHTRAVFRYPLSSSQRTTQRHLAPRSPTISPAASTHLAPRSPPISPDLPRVRLASNSIQVSALPAVPRGGETGCVPMSVPTL